MDENYIFQCWLKEFGDDSHVSFYTFKLAYEYGYNKAKDEAAEDAAGEDL